MLETKAAGPLAGAELPVAAGEDVAAEPLVEVIVADQLAGVGVGDGRRASGAAASLSTIQSKFSLNVAEPTGSRPIAAMSLLTSVT